MIATAALLGYAMLLLLFVRVCVWAFGRLEDRATSRFQQRLAATKAQADDNEETPMPDGGLTHTELTRLRARHDKVTAAVRQRLGDLAGEPDAEIQVLDALVVSNVIANPIAVAGIAALATLDLAVAQADIVRLQAELDGERATHRACRDRLRRATRGGAS